MGDEADVVLLNFYTLETAFDGNLGGVDTAPLWPATINSKEVYLEGSEISLQVRERVSGYLFDTWTSVDSIAQYADGATETSNPTTVVMRGPLTMRADSKPIDYLVSFDPNAPDASGEMADFKSFPTVLKGSFLRTPSLERDTFSQVGTPQSMARAMPMPTLIMLRTFSIRQEHSPCTPSGSRLNTSCTLMAILLADPLCNRSR